VDEITDFAATVLLVSGALAAALLGRRLTERLALPSAALFLVAAAIASDVVAGLEDALTIVDVERIAVVALIVILFDGGMHIGWRRFRVAATPILSLGVLGTFASAALIAVVAHTLLGFDWTLAGLIGAALAPTDPAVTFSVLGNREIRGRTGTILEGESGMNDPVGIALMIGMIELAKSDDGSFATVIEEFAVEMAVGLAVGVAGTFLLLPLTRRVALPEPGLYPLWTLGFAGIIYGTAAVLHGSGFLAVFIAGILFGDQPAPRKGEIERFHASLASLAEITAFVALGLTINLGFVTDQGLWLDGLVLAVLLGFVVRPLVIGLLLLPVRLSRGERLFVMWSGLKGAVPILLASLAVIEAVERSQEIYGIVFVVVLFSVAVQGTAVPWVAARLRVPMRRVQHETATVHRFVVRGHALADGSPIARLPLAERAWVSTVVRNGQALPIDGSMSLRAGDEVLVYADEALVPALRRIFQGR
jgi:cell volume regulation protein A